MIFETTPTNFLSRFGSFRLQCPDFPQISSRHLSHLVAFKPTETRHFYGISSGTCTVLSLRTVSPQYSGGRVWAS